MNELEKNITLSYELENTLASIATQLADSWEEVKQLRAIKKFLLVDNTYDKCLQYVYPLMQKDVQKILKVTADYPVGLILFGSSITMFCNVTSDIDICVKTKEYDLSLFFEVQKTIHLCSDHQCDVLYFNDLQYDDKIYWEIKNKGLVLREV